MLLRALSLDPADRYVTVSEFASAAQAIPAEAADTGRRSIAVLPFTNMSADAENEFFTDGISEEIINALTKVRALDVASRTSAFAFKGNKDDISAIGRKLKVHTVLEGSVRKAGNRLRISTQLIDVATSFQLWSERYDREMEDVFAIQDEIATSIVNALKVVLTPKEEAAIKKVPTQSVRAYEYYLRGRQLFHQRRAETLDAAEDLYRRAIALDPDYALAFAGLADCSCFRFFEHAGGDEALAQAESASRRALKLDPELAEAACVARSCSNVSTTILTKRRRSSSARWSSIPPLRGRVVTHARFKRRESSSRPLSSTWCAAECEWMTIKLRYLRRSPTEASGNGRRARSLGAGSRCGRACTGAQSWRFPRSLSWRRRASVPWRYCPL